MTNFWVQKVKGQGQEKYTNSKKYPKGELSILHPLTPQALRFTLNKKMITEKTDFPPNNSIR